MADEVKRLKKSPRRIPLATSSFSPSRNDGGFEKCAPGPAAFDAANEKKKGRYEQEACNLYRECEKALVPRPVSTKATAPKKRERGAESSEENLEAKCGLSQMPLSLQ